MQANRRILVCFLEQLRNFKALDDQIICGITSSIGCEGHITLSICAYRTYCYGATRTCCGMKMDLKKRPCRDTDGHQPSACRYFHAGSSRNAMAYFCWCWCPRCAFWMLVFVLLSWCRSFHGSLFWGRSTSGFFYAYLPALLEGICDLVQHLMARVAWVLLPECQAHEIRCFVWMTE